MNVTDLEIGETITHSPSRRTGALTRSLRTGTGLLSTLVSVIAVLNSFGRPQGLPLIPETVSSPEVTTSDEYDDVLGRHHEDCFSLLSPKEHWILFDSGAAAHCCPLDYAPDYPLLPVGKNPPDLKSATGIPLNIIGRKLIRYDAPGTVLYINNYVCDVPFCIVSVARMLLQDFCTVLTKDSMKLLTPQRTSVDITRHGTLLYLTPDIVPYHPDMKILEEGLGVETERVPGVETERAMSGPLLRQGVETERECAKNVTGVALWRGSKPNARGSKPNAGSISCGRRRIVALSLAKKWFDIILPSMYM